MRKFFSSCATVLRISYGATVIRVFPRRGITGLSSQAWQLLKIFADSKSTGMVIYGDKNPEKDHYSVCFLPSTREIWCKDEPLLLDDLAHLEELGFIRHREYWDKDKVYAMTRKGTQYARCLPKVQTDPPTAQEPLAEDIKLNPDLPPLPPPFSKEDEEFGANLHP